MTTIEFIPNDDHYEARFDPDTGRWYVWSTKYDQRERGPFYTEAEARAVAEHHRNPYDLTGAHDPLAAHMHRSEDAPPGTDRCRCGSRNLGVRNYNDKDAEDVARDEVDSRPYRVMCAGCGLLGPTAPTAKGASILWNDFVGTGE